MPKASGGPPFGDDIELPTKGIRADVLRAARQVWPQFSRRAILALGSQKGAARLLEAAALSLSHQLDRQKQKAPAVTKLIVALLKAHLDRALPQGKRPSKKKPVPGGKSQLAAGVANLSPAGLAALLPQIDDQTSMIIAMRSSGHSWKEIAAMLGITSSNARSLVLRTMGNVRPKRHDQKQSDSKKGDRGK